MRVIPVLDLRAGRAVWARGGNRAEYAPVRSVLVEETGDAVALARAFRGALGCDECYVADLDAIMGAPPQHDLLRQIAAVGPRLLIDAGVADAAQAGAALAAGAARVIVGSETLRSFESLAAIVRAHGRERVVFSLDLRAGQVVVPPGSPQALTPLAVVSEAVRAGVTALIVLDLTRVGSGQGTDASVGAAIRRAHPQLEMLVGGGIASAADLAAAARAGFDGALVASALHDGTLDADHVSDSR